MTKRLICLVLCVLMVLAAFTSCAKEDDAIDSTVDKASRFTSTLNFWLITESPEIAKVSELMYNGFNAEVDYAHLKPEEQTKYAEGLAIYNSLTETEQLAATQLGAINKAINKITKEKYKTQIKFRYVLASEYYAELEGAFAARSAAIANGTLEKAGISETEETVVNEYGIPELKYPTTPSYQVDIMYLDGAQRYRSYIEQGLLASMESMMEDAANQLTYYVDSVLMDSVRYNGVTYAVPNRRTIGEYIYLAVDAKLASDFNYVPEHFGNSLYSNETYEFLNFVYNTDYEEAVYPLYCEDGVELENIHYWNFNLDGNSVSVDYSDFSLFFGAYSENAVQGDKLPFTNVLSSEIYKQNLSKQVYYENTPGFLAPSADDKAAMRVVKGGYETKAELEAEGYAVLTIQAPRATEEDVFGSMFAISETSSDTNRSMEIITYLNTNEEFRNLLQYGIEGVNYKLATVEGGDEEYVVETADNVYKMDVNKTGNVFIAYPNSAEAAKAIAFGKEQNRDATAYPTVGMFFNLTDRVLNTECIVVVNAVSDAFKTSVMDRLTNTAEVNALYAEAGAAKTASQMATFLLSKTGEVTYEAKDGTIAVVTVDVLAKALTDMVDETIPDPATPGDVLTPAALYAEWCLTYGE